MDGSGANFKICHLALILSLVEAAKESSSLMAGARAATLFTVVILVVAVIFL
jgi:hypothetical protein